MAANFLTNQPFANGCPLDAQPCTPSDTTPLGTFARGFSFTGDGALKVTTVAGALSGTTVTFPAGTFTAKAQIWLGIAQVWATGTGMTGITLYY